MYIYISTHLSLHLSLVSHHYYYQLHPQDFVHDLFMKTRFFTIHHPSLGLSENRMPDFAPCWSAIFWGIPMIPTWLPIYHQFFIPILVSSIPIAIAPGWQISSIPIAINPLYHIIYPHSSLIRITDWLLQSDSIPFGKKRGLVVKGFHWIYPLFH